jgi:hypothetical protein
VEDCRVLDASRWMRQGILRQDFNNYGTLQLIEADTREVKSSIRDAVETCGLDTVRLVYTIAETCEQMNYAIPLQTTVPHHRGLRSWFTCPLMVNGKRCERRVQKLYLPPRGPYYGCRHCYHLSYHSRNQNATLRAIAKAQKIRKRLGGSASLLELFPEKPRGMWWRTYRHQWEEAKRAEERTSPPTAMMKYLNKLASRYSR